MSKKLKIELPAEMLDRKGKRGQPPALLVKVRTEEVVDMLLKCKPRKEIIKFLQEKYNIGIKACDNLITKGYRLIKEEYSVDTDAIINQHIQFYYHIIESWEDTDPRVQIQALAAIEKLLKIHSPETLVQNNKLEINLKDLTISELKELLKLE